MSAPDFFRPFGGPQEHPAHAVARRADGAIELLALSAGERVLDVGCGDGQLSAQLARQGAEVVGFDLNPKWVDAARYRGLEVKQGNAEELYFHQEFDAVFSHGALHRMQRADQVASGAFMALKPGGRFVGEFAGARNAQRVRHAIHDALERRSIDAQEVDPWFLPTAGEYQQVLERAGFHVSHISWFEQPTVLNAPIAEWIRKVAGHYLHVLPVEGRLPLLEEVTEELVCDLLDASGRWTVDTTRLRFRAEKKPGRPTLSSHRE